MNEQSLLETILFCSKSEADARLRRLVSIGEIFNFTLTEENGGLVAYVYMTAGGDCLKIGTLSEAL